jgi:hypothetical protein
MNRISYIPHASIDTARWDACIEEAHNGLIYGYSWYLNAVTEKWDALVLNDYEAVMPLTWNKKWGIHYLYQPYFCASLGVFSRQQIDADLMHSFLKKIPPRFRYTDIYLNHGNLFAVKDFPLTQRVNYCISLNQSYAAISSKYRNNLTRNIKKAKEANLEVRRHVPLPDILSLAKETLQRVSDINDQQVERFHTLYQAVVSYSRAETLGIFAVSGELLASAVFFYSHKRWYYILVGNHPNGKTLGASHYLIDRFIAHHAETDTVLDFEGSDLRNLAFFYSSFGAHEEFYPALRMNRLPALLKWLKD